MDHGDVALNGHVFASLLWRSPGPKCVGSLRCEEVLQWYNRVDAPLDPDGSKASRKNCTKIKKYDGVPTKEINSFSMALERTMSCSVSLQDIVIVTSMRAAVPRWRPYGTSHDSGSCGIRARPRRCRRPWPSQQRLGPLPPRDAEWDQETRFETQDQLCSNYHNFHQLSIISPQHTQMLRTYERILSCIWVLVG